jgi:site-specific recombinase XerD
MKKKVTLKRIFHRERWCIAIFFDFDELLKAKVKSITGSAFSGTHRCYYVDDTEDNLRLLLTTLKESAEIDISSISWNKKKSDDTQDQHDADGKQDASALSVSGGIMESDDISSPKTVWTMSGEKKENPFNHTPAGRIRYGPVEFRISEKEGLLVIRFLGTYDPEWIRELRSYGNLDYDRKRKEWLLPWSKLTCDSLADYFAGQGIGVNVKKQVVNEDLKAERKTTGDEIRSKPLSRQALDGLDLMVWFLDENRYSPRTRESYIAMLEFFFRYFSPKEPLEITEEEISRFLYDFIIRLGYSAAYQNQMVSAIKTYYTIAGKGKVNPEIFERPRRSRALPKVFSKEEVTRILNSSGNMKHKVLLWMIYSCGLRRSEVTNLKITDLDRERGIVNIREGKGRVDRFVPVPGKVWEKLDEYFSSYRPREYLFEGQKGGRYSSESVYRVFKGALIKAGIKKDVGVHSLRHSYATHLHENGLDIRYIQELLGHKSTRTTEIYTHVSRRNLVAVRSPIEDLDLK